MQLTMDEESAARFASDEMRKEGTVRMLEGAEEALDNAVRVSDGKIRTDAQQKLDQVRKDLAQARSSRC